jgi:hypothetical protein
MRWKDPAERHAEDTVKAIHEGAAVIATAIKQGFKLMADETKALADLTAAISNIGTAIVAEISALKDALAAQGVDNSPAIEAAVSKLNDLTAGLTASLPTPPAP